MVDPSSSSSHDRRFIEESFPVKEVGEISAKEKNIRHGHISTLHIWWARRPLAASRATAYAALVPPPIDIEEWQKQRDFIVELSKWENSNNQVLLKKARRDILQAHADRLSEELGEKVTVDDIESGKSPRPRVLDPFAGGGSYPLEALRLGCEAYANDYNPVAVLIEKATLEYPQKFGRPFAGMPEWAKPKEAKDQGKRSQPTLFDSSAMETSESFNPLLEAVRYWGNWVLEEARKELAKFYPPDPDGSIPVGYIWARTLPCQNPVCGQEIPLVRGFWLAKTDKRMVALYPFIHNGRVDFRVVGDGYTEWPKDFDPEKGTVARAVATCPICGSTIDDKTTRSLFQAGMNRQRLIAVALYKPKTQGKLYRVATEQDVKTYESAEALLNVRREKFLSEWGMNPIPDEAIDSNSVKPRTMWLYGMKEWGELFNARQKLSLITFIEIIRNVAKTVELDTDFNKAVISYLAINLDRLVDYGSTLCLWNYTGGRGVKGTFARQAFPMVWDYSESNPFNPEAAGWEIACNKTEAWIRHATQAVLSPPTISQASAVALPYPDKYFDGILTDPPYYDNVNYAELSDFFYVWLKRSLGDVFPELFSTPLVPKSAEIVANPSRQGSAVSATEFFERMLKSAFLEIRRVLKPNGVAVIVYAHKSTQGWETLINSLLDSNLVVSSAWPINTEKEGRVISQESAALASSIYIVARKMPRQPTGFYNDVRAELRQHLDAKLHRLWEEGIGGADFFIAAIGSAIEVFGKYEQVIDYEGNVVRANRLLEEVRTIATDYAVRQILHNGFVSEISELARLYVLWRWNYGEALVPFDEGRKLAQSCGVDLAQEWNKGGFVKKEKEFIRLLGPQQRKLDDLEDPRNMIDVLHKSLLLWEKGKRSEMVMALADHDYGRSEAFYRVAQAISETLPNESKEKKLLDGFLAGRERVQEEVGKAAKQGRLL